MDYNNKFNFIWGLIGGLFWLVSFKGWFRNSKLYIPKSYLIIKKFQLSRVFIMLLGVIAWVLISFSLSEPRRPIGKTKSDVEVRDIFFVIDVSTSMLANDFYPNRLEAAKSKIKEFIELRPTDRIGIIMFAEKIFTLLPLTTDFNLIKSIVDEIKVGFLGSGTNIGDAIGLGVARGLQSISKNKVIILLTDGVSNVGNITPIQAAEEAKKNNIKIYSIAIGSSQKAQIPVGNRRGPKIYQNIPGGSMDTSVLEKISDITDGSFYLAKDINALKNVLFKINSLEKSKVKISSQIIYKELFYKYLLAGVILLFSIEFYRKVYLKEVE